MVGFSMVELTHPSLNARLGMGRLYLPEFISGFFLTLFF
jgi:hypothetical protein